MKILILFFLVLLILFVMPIIFKTKINFNLIENAGEINLYLFGIRILYRKWKIGINKIIFIAKNNKEKHMILFDFNNESSFGDYFLKNFIKTIDVNTLKIFVKVGIEDYAMYTAILDSCINIPLQIVLSQIYKIKKPKRIIAKVMPDFYKNNFIVAISSSITISIIMVIWSLLVSYLKFKMQKRKLSYGK